MLFCLACLALPAFFLHLFALRILLEWRHITHKWYLYLPRNACYMCVQLSAAITHDAFHLYIPLWLQVCKARARPIGMRVSTFADASREPNVQWYGALRRGAVFGGDLAFRFFLFARPLLSNGLTIYMVKTAVCCAFGARRLRDFDCARARSAFAQCVCHKCGLPIALWSSAIQWRQRHAFQVYITDTNRRK